MKTLKMIWKEFTRELNDDEKMEIEMGVGL